jgi:hypothetical protein
MAGPELDVVVQLEQAPARAEQAVGTLVGVDGEVRPADRADEERVAGEQQPRLVATAAIDHGEREVLGAVAGRRDRADQNVAELELGTVVEPIVFVLRLCSARDVQGRACRLGEAPVAGDVVGVVVRLEHVHDPEVVLVGEVEVVLDLPLRVDDGRLPAVGDHVGRAREVLVQHLAEEHRFRRTRSDASEPGAPPHEPGSASTRPSRSGRAVGTTGGRDSGGRPASPSCTRARLRPPRPGVEQTCSARPDPHGEGHRGR